MIERRQREGEREKEKSENYQLVYQSRRKCEIYRDTGVSKNSEI